VPRQETTQTGSALGVTLIIMTLIGWSSVPLFLKHFSHLIDVWTSNGWRYGFSALLWAPVLIVGASRGRLPKGLWKAALVPAVFNSIGQTCFAWAHYKIDPGLLTFGLRLQIVFVGVGAYLLFAPERRLIRTRGYLIGATMVLGGTVGTMLLGESPPQGLQAFGLFLAVSSGLFFAAYALSVRYYMQGVGSITAFSAISQYTAVAMVVLMLTLGEDHGATAASLPSGQFMLLLLSAIIGIALGHVFYYASIARLGVAVSSGVVQLQPILVTAASWALFDERLTVLQFVCGAIAISGAATMLYVQHRLSRSDRALRLLAVPVED